MPDPFDALRGREPLVVPDQDFADALIRRVQQRLDSSSAVASVDDPGDPTDLEVIEVSARHPRRVWWLSAAAVLIVAVGVWVVAANRGDDSQTPAAPASTTAPDGTTTAANPTDSLPPELLGRWMSGPRADWSTTIGTSMLLESNRLTMSAANDNPTPKLRGDAAASGPNQFEVVNTADPQCGTTTDRYQWALSASGRVLTVTVDDGSCSSRSANVVGTYWKMGCVEPNDNCLGPLDAGSYASQFVRPLQPSPALWQPQFGAVTYTVPEGWANFDDWPFEFGLTTLDAFGATNSSNSVPTEELTVLARAGALTVAGRCAEELDAAVTTIDAMEARLRELPGLVVGDANPVTVGGLDGISLDLTVDAASLTPCGTDRVVPFASSDGGSFAIGERGRTRLYLLPRPSGEGFVAVVVATADAADFDAFAAEADAVVQSLQFS